MCCLPKDQLTNKGRRKDEGQRTTTPITFVVVHSLLDSTKVVILTEVVAGKTGESHNERKVSRYLDLLVSSSSKTPIPWFQVILYSEWVMLIVVAIAILWSSQTWRDLLWFAITVLLGGQLVIVSRLTQRAPSATSQPRLPMEPLPAPAPSIEPDLMQVNELEDLRWRHSLACDRYDSLGQSLTALNIQLQTALKLWETDQKQAHDFLVVAHEQGITAMQEIRRSISLLQTNTDSSSCPSPTNSISPPSP